MARTYRRLGALHCAYRHPCLPFYPEHAHRPEEIRRRARFHSDAGERMFHERYEGSMFHHLGHNRARVLTRARLRPHRLPEDDTPEMPVALWRDLVFDYP